MYNKIVGTLKLENLAYGDLRSPEEVFKTSGLTRQWQTHQMTNFDYIMQLNTIASRSYNDITQYPGLLASLLFSNSTSVSMGSDFIFR